MRGEPRTKDKIVFVYSVEKRICVVAVPRDTDSCDGILEKF